MNTQTHRLIFNPARGCLMAVAETARSAGKSGSGCTRARSRTSVRNRKYALSTPTAHLTDIYPSNQPLDIMECALAAMKLIVTSDTAQGANIQAAGNLSLRATGAGAQSNIKITGANLEAGQTATFKADNNIELLAAQNTNRQQSTNSASSASLGATFALGGSQNGLSFQAGASGSRGNGNGQDTTFSNTRVQAQQINLQSGGDTTLQGAVVKANTVTADIGGNLFITSPKVTGLIVVTPLAPAANNPNSDPTRDRLTGLPLDEKGRYAVQISVDGKQFAPKYFPCASSACVAGGQNLDASDPGTQTYLKAMDKKILDDINKGATIATIVNPAGVAGGIALYAGPATSVAAGFIEDQTLKAIFKEGLQAAATQYFQRVYGFSEALANRVAATVDLAGGWQAFVDRTKTELFGNKK